MLNKKNMWYTITLVVGIGLLLLAVMSFKKSLAFLNRCEKAEATVIELERRSDSDGTTYAPIFKFKTSKRQDVIHRHGVSSSPAAWDVGETTTIAYDPDDPSGSARLLTYFGVFVWAIILLAVAMPFIVIGGGYFLAQPYLK